MLRRFHVGTAAIMAVAVIAGFSGVWGAELKGHAIIAGRQKIREELSAAMSDGRLTRMEQYQILLHAKDLLPPEDVRGLERTLDRLAATSEPARQRMAQPAVEQGRGRGRATLMAYDAPPSEGGSPATSRLVGATPDGKPEVLPPGTIEGSPFHEEGSGEMTGMPPEGPYPQGLEPIAEGDCLSCEGQMMEDVGLACRRSLYNFSLLSSVDAFKGPMDLDNLNGNFGVRLGINGGVPISQRLGIGVQGGSNEVISDFHGTVFTENTSRKQNFTTVGLFQRIPARCGSLNWGFTYDWLFDDYYANLQLGQWRVKLAAEIGRCNEIGIWAAIPDHGDSALVGNEFIGFTEERFKPLAQGNLYWKHCWANNAITEARVGIAEEPGEIIFGFNADVPISDRLSAVGGFTYILPSAVAGFSGQSEEFWNVSIGLQFSLGRNKNLCSACRFSPLMPVADNGTFAVRRLPAEPLPVDNALLGVSRAGSR